MALPVRALRFTSSLPRLVRTMVEADLARVRHEIDDRRRADRAGQAVPDSEP
ncbi:MAG: hypothetical protein ACYC6Y_02530 [Thermoguttaceae bacterium]